MKIAIVEDRQEDARSLNAMVQKYCQQSNVYVEIDQYETGEEFLEEMPEQYDVIFLDIFLNKLSGIDVARSLRTRGEGKEEDQQKIIFVTTSTDYGLEGFELRATHYLVKPCTQEKVQNAMERVMAYMKNSFYITVTCRREEHKIPISKILFIDYRFGMEMEDE
ncbi:MAG: response regulator [Hespellia sp.]|nr:response regulator [Hespellia sp.]